MVNFTSRLEYDYRLPERVKAEKLARGVLYILMLQIEGDTQRAGQLMVEVPRLPVFGAEISAEAAPMEVLFTDEDAQPIFRLTGYMKADQVFLQPNRLQLVNDHSVLQQGYFLNNEDELHDMMQIHELVSVGGSVGNLSL